jgi:hypothetical protein
MKIGRFLLLVLAMCPGISGADCPQIQGNTVIFGGRGSETEDMVQCYPTFLALSHKEGSMHVSCLAKQINSSGGQKFVIAGHSSGAEDAERLVNQVKDKTKVRLVLLEGFAYQANQRGGVKTTCWYAQNTKQSIRGFNAPSMLNPSVCPQPAKAFEADWCHTELCLHLSNVNLNVPSELSRATVLTEGLANCRGNEAWVEENLDWLNQ